MRDIYWNKLNTFQKTILVMGWCYALNLLFWIIMGIVYYSDAYAYRKKKERKIYDKFFNPHTLKVPYFFGWVFLITCIILLILAFLGIL